MISRLLFCFYIFQNETQKGWRAIMRRTFSHYLPVNLIFGTGKAEVLGEEAARYGKRVMVVTGRGST